MAGCSRRGMASCPGACYIVTVEVCTEAYPTLCLASNGQGTSLALDWYLESRVIMSPQRIRGPGLSAENLLQPSMDLETVD